MALYTREEYENLLNRTYVPRCPRDNRPRSITDVTDKGEEILEYILPHPTEGRLSATLQATIFKGYVKSCALHFGVVRVAAGLDPDEALSALEEVLSDRIVAIVRYKSMAAYEDHRKASSSPSEWLYQMPDDEERLASMKEKLQKPATLGERLSGKRVGIFEEYRWSGSTLIKRT